MAAPYTVREGEGGFFQLVPAVGDGVPQPTRKEAALARAVNGLVAWAHDHPDESKPLLPAFVDGLRAIAEQGLTGEARDVAAARQRFQETYPSAAVPADAGQGDAAQADATQSGAAQEDATQADAAQPGPAERPAPGQGSFTVALDNDQIVVTPVAGTKPSDAQFAFAGELDRRERLIRAIFRSAVPRDAHRPSLLHRALERLAWAGELGLQGRDANVTLGQLAVQAVLLDTLQEHGATIRDAYLRRLAWAYAGWTVFLTALAILYMVVVGQIPPARLEPALAVPNLAVMLLIVAIWSLSFGAWLSAVLRVEPDSPEVLDSIVQTTLGPKLRAVYVLGFGVLALLLLHKGAVVFALGRSGEGAAFTTEHVFRHLSAAILTGGFLGLGEAALPNAVVQRSAALVAALSPR